MIGETRRDGPVPAGGDWRSRFSVFALTTLVLPATSLPHTGTRPSGNGLRCMYGRAEIIGAELQIGPGPGGRGTAVALALPHPGGSP